MKIETVRTELRRLLTKLTPHSREEDYYLECKEFISDDGEMGIEFSASFKDAEGNWHISGEVSRCGGKRR